MLILWNLCDKGMKDAYTLKILTRKKTETNTDT